MPVRHAGLKLLDYFSISLLPGAKLTFPAAWSIVVSYANPAGLSGGDGTGGEEGLRRRLFFHCAADVDDIVCDDAKAHPSVHSDEASVVAAGEAVAALDHTDASFGSGAPFLSVTEPALPLLMLAFGAFG